MRWQARGPAAEPVAASSPTPSRGENMRVFQRVPEPAKAFAPTKPKAASALSSGASAATSSSSVSAT